jgi:hypothetical protein
MLLVAIGLSVSVVACGSDGPSATQSSVSTATPAVQVIYDDALRGGVTYNLYNGVNDIASTTTVKVGVRAIKTAPDTWAGIFLDLPDGLRTAGYTTLRLWVNGGSDGLDRFAVSSKHRHTIDVARVELPEVAANEWKLVEISLGKLVGSGFDTMRDRSLWFTDISGEANAPIYLDQIELVATTAAGTSS